MEQLDLFDSKWINTVDKVLYDITLDEELPENALQLIENHGKKNGVITSYSITVMKPDFPKGINPNGIASNILLNIKIPKATSNSSEMLLISIPNNLLSPFNDKFPEVPLIKKKSDANTRAAIPISSENTYEYFLYIVRLVLDNYFRESSDSFGCCHLYMECSNAKKCLHVNKLYAKSCSYRKHLVQGRIFYGKNRNV